MASKKTIKEDDNNNEKLTTVRQGENVKKN